VAQLLDLGIAADEAREPAGCRGLKPRPHGPGPSDFVDGDGPVHALDIDRAQWLDLHVSRGEAQTIGSYQDRARGRELLHA
jgi:hypothetical protein